MSASHSKTRRRTSSRKGTPTNGMLAKIPQVGTGSRGAVSVSRDSLRQTWTLLMIGITPPLNLSNVALSAVTPGADKEGEDDKDHNEETYRPTVQGR